MRIRHSIPLVALVALVALAFILLASIVAHGGGEPTTDVYDPDTTVLTDDNFADFISNDLVLVEFYAPWCGHCKALAPEYASAATQLAPHGIKLGKLDATVHSKTAGAHSISGYPTLKIFRNGKAFEYGGARKADGIVAYMKRQVGPAVKTIDTRSELDALLAQHTPAFDHVILGLFARDTHSQLQSAFSMLASRMRDEEFLFVKSVDDAVKKAYDVEPNGEALITLIAGERHVYPATSSKLADVESFIRRTSLPLVGEYSDATSSRYTKSNKLPIVKVFINVDRSSTPSKPSKTMTYYLNRFKKLASRYVDRLVFTYADRASSSGSLQQFNIADDEEHPLVIEDVGKQKSYKYEADDDDDENDTASSKSKKKSGLNIDSWIRFIDEYLEGRVSPYVRSQRAPRDNMSRAVKIATASNFESIVEDEEKDVMIEFYAPWCGHCKALEPKYDELGAKLKSIDGVTIAKLDATANDWDRSRYEVQGYPTIYFRAAGEKTPRKYEGSREVKDMYNYIKKNGKMIKQAKKKKKNQE